MANQFALEIVTPENIFYNDQVNNENNKRR